MDLITALQHALDGESILFVGAGFSIGAKNIQGQSLKSGPKLAELLCSEASLSDVTRLEDAAEDFIDIFGSDRLINLLQNQFSVHSVADYHIDLANISWKRIYTTNYDNVLETAYQRAGKRLTTVSLSNNIRDIVKGHTICVHLNGCISNLDRESVLHEIKLTDSSYLTSIVSESEWASLFRQDLRLARSVFFVGYSLADLDIKRLLYDNADIQQKTFFVLGEKPSGADVRRANKFGRVIKGMGASSLASEFVKLKTTYQPSEKRKLIYYCYEENKIVEDHPDFSDDYLIDLLAMGDVKSEFIYKSLYGNQSYYCERSKIKQILDFMKSKHQAIVVHSDLANGKTIFLEGVKIRAIEQNYTVFTLANRSDDIYRETEQILRSDGPILIIIENYYDWFDVIDYISINWNENTKLILSGRSSIHDVTFDTLNESLEIDDIQELSVNNLDKTEITWLAQILDEFGLWGERASWSLIRKTKFIEKNCGGQFHAVLLTLMSAPQVVRRFVKITEELSRKQSYYKVIISILIFAVLGRKIDFDILYEFWGNIVSGSEFKRNLAINEIISFDSDKIRMRSAIAAQYILKNTTNPNLIVDTLIDIVSVANKLSSVNSVYRQYWKELVRFGNLHHILPENDRQILVIRYYEAIKSFEQSKNHPLFWLQYAIACITINEFERAEFYFDTAYSLARSRDWDLRQIDNHYARFLLSRSTYEGDSDTCMTHFRKARKIINNQMVGEDRRHYPYNVASYYGEFYEKFEPELSNKNRSEIGRAARYVLERIDKLPAGRQNNYYVKNCRHIMEYLVMETDVV